MYMQYNYAICLDTMCSATQEIFVHVCVFLYYMPGAKSAEKEKLYLYSFIVWFLGSMLLMSLLLFRLLCVDVAPHSRSRSRILLLKVERFFSLHPFISLVVLCSNRSQRADIDVYIFLCWIPCAYWIQVKVECFIILCFCTCATWCTPHTARTWCVCGARARARTPLCLYFRADIKYYSTKVVIWRSLLHTKWAFSSFVSSLWSPSNWHNVEVNRINK